MRCLSTIIILISCGLLMSLAQAAPVKNLNTATVPVPNRTTAALNRALPKAFSQVLVKTSGNQGVATLPAIQNAMPAVKQLVRSYGYQTKTTPAGQPQLELTVSFDKAGVATLLKQAHQPIWQANRPSTLMWLSVQHQQQPSYILSNSSDVSLETALTQVAKQRGLPMLTPVMDLTDQAFINSNSHQLFNSQKLQAAAKRYAVPSVLAGRLVQQGDQWQGQWMLMYNGEPFRWNNQGDTPQQVLNAAVNNMANLLANQLTVTDSQALLSSVMVEFMGIDNLSDYAHALRYLRQLPSVSKVTVKDMGNSALLVNMSVSGGEQALIKALQSNHKVAVIPAPLSQGDHRADLYYQWLNGQPNATTGLVTTIAPASAPAQVALAPVTTPLASPQSVQLPVPNSASTVAAANRTTASQGG